MTQAACLLCATGRAEPYDDARHRRYQGDNEDWTNDTSAGWIVYVCKVSRHSGPFEFWILRLKLFVFKLVRYRAVYIFML
jgi:hypothetical protein